MKELKILYYGAIAITLAIVVIYETGLMDNGILAHDTVMSYHLEWLMEILTICLIPLALKLFSFNNVKTILTVEKEKALLKWGTIRILMLGIPLIINTILYYLFQAVAFGYMSIVILISMAFITPTKSRCQEEISENI